MIINDFNASIDRWIGELEPKTFDQICAKPNPRSWSLGQTSMHLVETTHYFLQQAVVCAATNDSETEQKSATAANRFENNAFPNGVFAGPPSNDFTPQPESKEQLLQSLHTLKVYISTADGLISSSAYRGKTPHPTFGYFNASEWLHYAEMHFRHHFRQASRIKEFLKDKVC